MSSALRQRIRAELAQAGKRQAIASATWGGVQAKWRQWRALAAAGRLQDWRDRAREAKDRVLTDHGAYWQAFTRAVQSHGGTVHFAGTAPDAVAHVLAIARQHGAHLVVKTKSMVTEEIGLTLALEAAGVETVETDLGEYIVQLAGDSPAHIVGPAMHLTRHDVAGLFARRHGGAVNPDPAALTAIARRVLREQFLAAEIGITGANFGVAETGSIILVTNEGNGEMVTALPPVMITVMGLEKLVATWADLEPLMALLPRTSTGQNITSYVTAITGVRGASEADGPEELHVIVLDAGRSRLLGTPYQSALRCIRCGACQDACPVFRQIGGHGYGTTYGGPIGVVISPLLAGQAELLDACSLCGACTETCPVAIPLHGLIREQRAERIVPAGERWLFRVWGWAWSSPVRYRWVSWVLRVVSRRFSRDGYLTWLPGPLRAWGEGRDFPAPAARPLHERWADLEREGEPRG